MTSVAKFTPEELELVPDEIELSPVLEGLPEPLIPEAPPEEVIPAPKMALSNDQYQALPDWSSTALRQLRKKGARWVYERYVTRSTRPKPPSEALRNGRVVNSLVLGAEGGDRLAVTAVEGRNTKMFRAAKDYFGDSRFTISLKEARRGRAQAAAILQPETPSAETAREILSWPGYNEYQVRTKVDLGGDMALAARGAFDLLRVAPTGQVILGDLKTTRAESFGGPVLARTVEDRQYDLQIAWYVEILKMLGINVDLAVFVFVRNEEPYDVSVQRLPAFWLMQARKAIRTTARQIVHCQNRGETPWQAFWERTLDIEEIPYRTWHVEALAEDDDEPVVHLTEEEWNPAEHGFLEGL